MIKTCSKCKEPEKDFYPNVAHVDGLQSQCKDCCLDYKKTIHDPVARRRYNLKYNFGITPEDYEDMLTDQNGGCAICGVASTRRRLDIDHDHETGKVRGLLCEKCNRGLGFFKDNIETLKKVIKYLTK